MLSLRGSWGFDSLYPNDILNLIIFTFYPPTRDSRVMFDTVYIQSNSCCQLLYPTSTEGKSPSAI